MLTRRRDELETRLSTLEQEYEELLGASLSLSYTHDVETGLLTSLLHARRQDGRRRGAGRRSQRAGHPGAPLFLSFPLLGSPSLL